MRMSYMNVLWHKFKAGYCEVDFLCEPSFVYGYGSSFDLNWIGWLVLTVLGLPVVTMALVSVLCFIVGLLEEEGYFVQLFVRMILLAIAIVVEALFL